MVAPLQYSLYVPKTSDKDCPVCKESISNSYLKSLFTPIVAHSGGGVEHPMHLACAKTAYEYSNQCPSCRVEMNNTFPIPFKVEIGLAGKITASALLAYVSAMFTFECLKEAILIGMGTNIEAQVGRICGPATMVGGFGSALLGRIEAINTNLSLKGRALAATTGIAGLAWTYMSWSSATESEIKFTNRLILAPIFGVITWLNAKYAVNKIKTL